MGAANLEQTVTVIVALAKGPTKLPTKKEVEAKLALPPDPMTLDMSIYGQAVTDAKKVLAERALPAVQKTLDSPLTDLFLAGGLSQSMYRYDKQLMEKIKQEPGYKPIQEQTIQKLATVFAQCELQGVLATSHARAITIRQFLKSGQPGQMRTIDALWDECTEAGTYNTRQSAMVDNTNPVARSGGGQLPSSIHPERDRGGRANSFKAGHSGMPFQQLGVGFRVEGSGDDKKLQWHIDRINKSGMVPQVTLPQLMLDLGKNIDGTKVSGSALAPRLNKAQKDLWNESGVCVARSLFGATAFPLREHKGNVALWAIDVAGLTGYDTEAWQLANRNAGSGPWRPGEKCFPRITPDRIIGHIVIEKLGDAGGWNFRVPKEAQWSAKVSGARKPQRDYIEAELTAWRDTTVAVDTFFDFQQ